MLSKPPIFTIAVELYIYIFHSTNTPGYQHHIDYESVSRVCWLLLQSLQCWLIYLINTLIIVIGESGIYTLGAHGLLISLIPFSNFFIHSEFQIHSILKDQRSPKMVVGGGEGVEADGCGRQWRKRDVLVWLVIALC